MFHVSLIDMSPSRDDVALLERIWDGERLPPDMTLAASSLCRRGLCRPVGAPLAGREFVTSAQQYVLTRAGRETLARHFGESDDADEPALQRQVGFERLTNVHTIRLAG